MNLFATLALGALSSPFKRPGRRPGATVPAPAPTLRIVEPDLRVDPNRLAAYARICGFPGTGPLPLPYPHVLAFPAAMRLMAAPGFPLPLPGLVHTWIEVTGHHPLLPGDRPELTVYVAGMAPHRRGTEATVVTEARLAGELVWASRSGYLARHRTNAGTEPDPDPGAAETDPRAPVTDPDPEANAGPVTAPGPVTAAGPDERPHIPPPPARAQWLLPADLGRRYGAASGDRNPIHLHPLTARVFGFPRPIAHGMWTFARCLAEWEPLASARVRADFRAPVPLPGTVTYAADPPEGTFQLRTGETVHLTGTVTSAARP
ncbi:MaoC/PaaZ C-terminal domain-containing protein [Streptomyces sp. NPDC006368]|uniref:MaoC/PaaZ C-terminal domain-containing protein n=1 Tax=Streptomyces sp. NPDC006368 TaxID=3156760 RepID=UPI0033B39943